VRRRVPRLPKRVKRDWRPPPFNIGSNSAQNFTVYYTASGPGVNMDPVGLLTVDRKETDVPLLITVVVDDVNDNKPEFTGPQLLWVTERSKIGNENGNFKIQRDPKTNDGLLSIAKPLNYEKTKNVKLKIQAQNEAKLVGSQGSWLSIPVGVAVGNVDEGPEFTARTVSFNVRENTPNGTLIGKYTA
ncbi:hypothetical protein CRUP_015822, partial [Coryphaenoides rupestris]